MNFVILKEEANKAEGDDEEKEEEGEEEAPTASQCDTINLNLSVKELNSDMFLLVNTMNWEDNVIIEASQAKTTGSELINERIKYAGWVPSTEHRTLFSYQSKVLGKKVEFLESYKDQSAPTKDKQTNGPAPPITWNSIFPNENYELIYGDWESKIIIDTDNIDNELLLQPPEFYIDPNDDNLLLGVPEDAVQLLDEARTNKETDLTGDSLKRDKAKSIDNRSRISKNLLGRATIKEDGEENELGQTSMNPTESKSFWNISNDDFYNPKTVGDTATVTKNVSTNLVLQHTQSALELRHPLFPTHLSAAKLRSFHRHALKRLGPDAGFVSVGSLLLKQSKEPKMLEAIKNASELSVWDRGELILAEYSEQYPPLMMQVGMATKIRNYYKKKFNKDDGPQNLEFGELVYVNQSPFLGSLKPGELVQALENYMYRAPVYKHKIPEQDFVMARSKHSGLLVRANVVTIFTVGQQCPLIEVPGPNSKRANSFIKDFLQAYIFRLFHRSQDVPKRIKMEDVRRAFPSHAESSIRKRLKLYADFRRTGNKFWLIFGDTI